MRDTGEQLGPNDAIRLKKGWSASGTIRSKTGDKVSLQADFSSTPGDYTVQFGFTPPADGTTDPLRPRARVLWTVEGNEIQRIVDVVDGCAISGTAQAVRVIVEDHTIQIAPGPVTASREYGISIAVVKGTRPVTENPPTLNIMTEPASLGLGQTWTEPVPQGAGVVSVYVPIYGAGVIVENTVRVNHEDVGGRILRSYDPRYFQWVPLAPGTVQVTVHNGTGTIAIRASVVFGVNG